jgi:putative ABC transport system permease protein
VYYSARQARAAQHMLLARGAGNVRTLRTFMAGRVAAADPQLVVSRDETLASQVDHQLLGTRVFGGMIGTFAMVALVLAVIGTYGVVAFGVASRTREIGIRMALGGSHAAVLRHVMGSTLAYVAVGMLVGLALGYLLARLLRVFLFGVSALDPLAYAVVCVILAVVAAVACWLPARRATRVDPLIALRAD